MKPLVSVTIVTTNDGRYIRRCLDSVFAQNHSPIEVIVVDNASTDGSRELLAGSGQLLRLHFNEANRGFCAAQNQATALARGDWILCLNPDTKLNRNCISELVRAGEFDDRIGIVCPKILRMGENGSAPDPPRLDSTGAYITPWLCHHDRGSQQVDHGQYDKPEYVFGYTGAVVLFRRAMVEDISIRGEFMDEDFFYYREDADIAWRAQLLGWRCLYTPRAVAYHVRRVFEANRRSLPPLINLHSAKNRFLMRIKNITPGVYRRVFWRATTRDLGVLAYCLVRERSSLPGLWFVLKNCRRIWAKRQWVQARCRVPDEIVCRWFNTEPTTFPLEVVLGEQLERPRAVSLVAPRERIG